MKKFRMSAEVRHPGVTLSSDYSEVAGRSIFYTFADLNNELHRSFKSYFIDGKKDEFAVRFYRKDAMALRLAYNTLRVVLGLGFAKGESSSHLGVACAIFEELCEHVDNLPGDDCYLIFRITHKEE